MLCYVKCDVGYGFDTFTWFSKVMGRCLVIAQVDLKRVMIDGLALVMLKCTLIHASYYYDLMIELLD